MRHSCIAALFLASCTIHVTVTQDPVPTVATPAPTVPTVTPTTPTPVIAQARLAPATTAAVVQQPQALPVAPQMEAPVVITPTLPIAPVATAVALPGTTAVAPPDAATNPLVQKIATANPVAGALLIAATKGRDFLALSKALPAPAIASGPVYARAEWDTAHGPCGSGVRPYIWPGNPVVGSQFVLSYDPLGAPRTDNVYVWPMVYVLISLTPPLLVGTALPGSGCTLWFDPSLGSTVVWGFSGQTAYHDGFMSRETNERQVRCEFPVIPELNGRTAWTQMVTFDAAEAKTSMVYAVTFGALR